MKGKLYPVDVYSVAALRNMEGGAQAEPGSGRRGRKQRRAGTQGLAAAAGPAALSGNRTRSTDTISKIKFKQMVGRQHEIEKVCCLPVWGYHCDKCACVLQHVTPALLCACITCSVLLLKPQQYSACPRLLAVKTAGHT